MHPELDVAPSEQRASPSTRKQDNGVEMIISAASIAGSFFSELKWAREAIVALSEAKIHDRPIGLDGVTRQPDALFVAFARRALLFYPYIRRPGFSVGSPDAYTANIATLHYYVERERQEEVQSVKAALQELTTARAQGANVGLLTSGGNLDDFASWFAVRDLPIDAYYRGRLSVGEPAAYDENIARIQAYLVRVNAATAR